MRYTFRHFYTEKADYRVHINDMAKRGLSELRFLILRYGVIIEYWKSVVFRGSMTESIWPDVKSRPDIFL